MGKVYEQITEEQAEFIGRQKLFFVATAPLASDGHVNLSPKGYDSFALIGPNEVACWTWGARVSRPWPI